MNMRFDRSSFFKYVVEQIINCNDLYNISNYDTNLLKYKVPIEHKELSEVFKHDATSYHHKSIISLLEAIDGIMQKKFSWATIKLYYSVFYSLRSLFYARGFAFYRSKSMYILELKPGNSFEKLRGKGYANDHEATINMFTQKYKDDFILSNTIDGINSLEWLKKRREQINYLQLKFLDPNPPYFMKELAKLSPSDLYHMIQEFYKEDVYIFDKDHAILALPIRQISRTFSELKVARIEMDYGKEIVDHLSRILSDDAIISLIKQKSLQ